MSLCTNGSMIHKHLNNCGDCGKPRISVGLASGPYVVHDDGSVCETRVVPDSKVLLGLLNG